MQTQDGKKLANQTILKPVRNARKAIDDTRFYWDLRYILHYNKAYKQKNLLKFMENSLDLSEFIPTKIVSGKNNLKYHPNVKIGEQYINLSYIINGYNNSKREYSTTIPRFISNSERTFEVLGLLQAEMGKTQNGNLSFANNEPKIINYILNWFEKELELNKETWRWSIKLNINDPLDKSYKKEIESKIIKFWTKKAKIDLEKAYPKKVTYIKNTKNTTLNFYDHGTLVLEYKNNIFSQIIKNFVKKTTYEDIINQRLNSIKGFIRGILAGESTVELCKHNKKYRIHLSTSKKEEKEIYYQCLKKLGIDSIKYKEDKLVVSKRKNLIHLLNQRLMTIHPKKYNKFLNMMEQYPNIKKETKYFKPKGKNVWNKYSQEKINEIIRYKKVNPDYSCRKIAKLAKVSPIKVSRVLKKHNLGKRTNKTPEKLRKEIADFAVKNPKIKQYGLTEKFEVSKNVVNRAIRKYSEEMKNN